MRTERLPLTYGECRARFRRACVEAGVAPTAHPIDARGPDGELLTIDTARIGASDATRVLVVLSGVHGVEAFLPSVLQSELIASTVERGLPDDAALLLVHAVNPWGMAWWRRQNESNVDLNRNWMRSDRDPVHNEPYEAVHEIVCPTSDTRPSTRDMFAATSALVDEHGLAWITDAITAGQYRHPDGLHFGGDRTEQSCRILEHVVADELATCEQLLTLDLHTGAGPRNEVVFLCNRPEGSPRHQLLAGLFGYDRTIVTANVDAPTGTKSGGIAVGLGGLLPNADAHSTVVEWGTEGELEQLAATHLESWVHRCADRADPDHADIVWRYRNCFSPDDREWELIGLEHGRTLLDTAVGALVDDAIS